jgi:hypothetical protein
MSAELANGALKIDEFHLLAPRGRFDGTLEIEPRDKAADVHVTFGGDDLTLNVTRTEKIDEALADARMVQPADAN